MIKKIVLGAALLGLSAVAVAGPSEGDIEVVFSNAGGGLSFNSDETELGAGFRAGYFMSSVHEFGGGADFTYTDTDADSVEALNLAGFYRYNMATGESKDWCYGGVELELVNVTDSDLSTETIRPHFGKKWMLSDDVAFDINGGIIIPTDSEVDETFDVRFGLGIFF
jgi:hypothetical protein